MSETTPRTHDLTGSSATVRFDNIQVADARDLANLLSNLVPVIAGVIAKGRDIPAPKDDPSWGVNAGGGTGQGWHVGGTVSTNVGGTTVTVGGQTGSGGTSGSVGVSGSF